MRKATENARNEMWKSIFGLTNTIAATIALFGTGPLYSATRDWVYGFAASYYGYTLADIITLGWGAICAAFIYFDADIAR